MVGNILDRTTLVRASVENASAVILALGNDSTTLFAATVLRDFTSKVPIIARVNRAENVQRIHRAGADFALSLAEVAGKLLAQKLLGAQWVPVDARVKLIKVEAGNLAGSTPASDRVGQRTGCSIVAIERDGAIATDFDSNFKIQPGDHLVICGREDAVGKYLEASSASDEV